MVEVSEAKLMRIRRDDRFIGSNDMLEIIADGDTCCPSIIGLKNPYETEFDECYYQCKECWQKALAEVEDFRILWKYKGSDEYVENK